MENSRSDQQKSPAIANKANREIETTLRKKFNAPVTILKGHNTARKIIQIG